MVDGVVIYSTAKAHKVKTDSGQQFWIPKSAVKCVYKARQQLKIYSWFNPIWLA